MLAAEDVEVTVMEDLLRLDPVFVNQFYIFALREGEGRAGSISAAVGSVDQDTCQCHHNRRVGFLLL